MRSHEVYDQLRTEIARGELRPNERLIEAELAQRLSVSRTPIRESIQRLASDGLVVHRRRAWFVREHSPAEITALYEVREALEAHAARLAAERATAEERKRITALSRYVVGEEFEPEPFVRANTLFHNTVADSARNAVLSALLVANRDFYFNRRISVAYSEADVQVALAEHVALAEAVVRGDGDAAEQITRQHISRSLTLTLRKLA